MSGPRPQRSTYHQKALQQIRNSLQPFATSESGSTSSGLSSLSSNDIILSRPPAPPPSPSRHSPSSHPQPSQRGIEYRAQQYPFVPSQVPVSVQQLLRRIDSPSSPSSSSSNSPTSQLTPIIKKPTLIIKSTVVPKPVLQNAVPYSLPPPPPYNSPPPPLPPKPSKKNENNNLLRSPRENGGITPPLPKMPIEIVNSVANKIVPERPTPMLVDNKLSNSHHNNNNIHNNINIINDHPRLSENNYKMTNNIENKISEKNSPARTNEINGKLAVNNDAKITTGDGTRVPEIHTHESPIPERKKLSREKEEERFESKVRVYSPQAFKFFMEQHIENVIKSHQERMHRRLQLESEMAKVGLGEEAQTQMRRMLSQKESNYIRLKRAKMDKSMFKSIRTIGVGAFGEVALVRKIDSQHLYAMKTLRKSDVLRRNQVAHVKAERDILAEADNEWVVKLYYSFQDMDHLYFVMDYIPGGDLMSLLIKKGIFEESLAQFYIAELTCAVESVHKMGFIHRDIKPDNILIDRDGHIKLTDFGLCTGFRWTHNSKYYQDTPSCQCDDGSKWQMCGCEGEKPLERRRKKEHVRCLAHSLVGTPNYIAPEVLMRTGYTQLCDWWSVGVILYEMLVGQPPFLAPSPAETQYKVINWANTLRIPVQANLSNHAKDLILKLCTDHTRRLGKGGAHQVKSHLFFASIDFEAGLRRAVAPYIPKIRHPTDTSNFDPCDGDKPEDTDSSPFDSNQFHGFFEFTFRRFFDDAYNEDGGPVYV